MFEVRASRPVADVQDERDFEDKVLVVDFGSQYTQLIARRVREIGVYCEIFNWDKLSADAVAEFGPRCIILSGGPESVAAGNAPCVTAAVFDCGVPVLGICYGMQAMARQFGGRVEPSLRREFGRARMSLVGTDRLLGGLDDDDALDVWMSHGDKVVEVPPGFKVVAATADSPVSAMADEERRCYGLQFHPEVTHTLAGRTILERFVVDISGCARTWTVGAIVERCLDDVRRQVGSDEVVLGLSGGVDSMVAAVLIHRAIGAQLHCVFVDTGLLRLGEPEQVAETFSRHIGIDLVQVCARKMFFGALKGIADPEEKRRSIGSLFVDVFEREAAKFRRVRWLAQGTIYPDVIESAGVASGSAHLIKSHHNVGGLPERMRLKLLEPLSLLFKDEVRQIGLELGLPAGIIGRHPFPGPGLAVRVLGEVKEEYVDLLRVADSIFIEELRREGLYDEVSQAFAVFLPVKSVSVMGDSREYNPVVVLRAVKTSDFMTADRACLPKDFLDRVARRIINEVGGISRVCYDITGKPPATIEWE